MNGMDIHKNGPVSVTQLTLGLRVGFISSHLTVDKLFPVNPRVIMAPPMMSLLYAYVDDFTLLKIVPKPTNKPAVAASLNRDLARTQEW